MGAAIRAGAGYFAIAFGLGLVLGTARVLVLEPVLGPLAAVLLELPIMLAASWLACRALFRRLAVPVTAAAALAMGSVAFLLLMLAEFALALWTGVGASDYFAQFREPARSTGLLGQFLFAAFPLILVLRARPGASTCSAQPPSAS